MDPLTWSLPHLPVSKADDNGFILFFERELIEILPMRVFIKWVWWDCESNDDLVPNLSPSMISEKGGIGAWGRMFKGMKGMKCRDSWGKRNELNLSCQVCQRPSHPAFHLRTGPWHLVGQACVCFPASWGEVITSTPGGEGFLWVPPADVHQKGLFCFSLGLCSKEGCLWDLGCLKGNC